MPPRTSYTSGSCNPIIGGSDYASRALVWPLPDSLGGSGTFSPFSYGTVDYRLAAPIAVLLVTSGFLLLPAAAELVRLVAGWIDEFRSPCPARHELSAGEINYNQMWVQVVVVAPLLIAGLLVAAVMWGYVQPGNYASLRTVAPGDGGVNINLGIRAYTTFGALFMHAPEFWPFPLTVVFISLLFLAYCSVRTIKTIYGILAMALAPAASIVVLHALMCGVMMLFQYLIQRGPVGQWAAYVWGPLAVLCRVFAGDRDADRHCRAPVDGGRA